jgi:cytidylate kinase
MPAERRLEALQSYLRTQRRHAAGEVGEETAVDTVPFVTLSRQAGTGGHDVARHLASTLGRTGIGRARWRVYDKSLLRRVVEDHDLPPEVVRDLEETDVPELQTIVEEMFGSDASPHSLAAKTSRTVLRLALTGSAVIVGRGGNLVTRWLPGGLRVRLVGSDRHRIARLMTQHGETRARAEDRMKREDEGRRRYVRKFFAKDIDDPSLYDLVIRVDRFDPERTARLVAEGLRPTREG